MAQRRRHVLKDLTFEPTSRWVRGWLGERDAGHLIVDSRNPSLVWEPGRFLPHYAFSAEDVDWTALRLTTRPGPRIHGEGTVLFDLRAGHRTLLHAAWSWPDEQLQGAVAFDWEARPLVRGGPRRSSATPATPIIGSTCSLPAAMSGSSSRGRSWPSLTTRC